MSLSARIFSFRLPLHPPLPLLGHLHRWREGMLLQLSDSDGHVSLGEVSPLPGLHRETLAEAQEQLAGLLSLLPELPSGLTLTTLRPLLHEWRVRHDLFPSVCFGLETALLHLAAQRGGSSIARFLNPQAAREVRLNGLLTTGAERLPRLQALLNDGCPAIKIKVGASDVVAEATQIRQLATCLPPGVTLRLDANRAWSLEQALRFADALGGAPLEYIEEPLRDAAGLERLGRESGLPLALDESLAENDPQDFALPHGTVALVVKPAVLGGAFPVLAWAEQARRGGQSLVVSSAFSSSVGLIAEASLAAALVPDSLPAGLATWRWLQQDVLREPFRAPSFRVDVENLMTALKQLNSSALQLR